MADTSIETLRQVFDQFDTDKSGWLSYDEVTAAAKELGQSIEAKDIERVGDGRGQ